MAIASFAAPADLRPVAPRDRLVRLLDHYHLLLPRQALELVSDQDPEPLYHQLQQREPGLFAWDTVEGGPDVWRVRVTRLAPTSGCGGGGCSCS